MWSRRPSPIPKPAVGASRGTNGVFRRRHSRTNPNKTLSSTSNARTSAAEVLSQWLGYIDYDEEKDQTQPRRDGFDLSVMVECPHVG